MKIKLIDAICGAGKTTAMFNKIRHEFANHQVVYISPNLSEVGGEREGKYTLSEYLSSFLRQRLKTPAKWGLRDTLTFFLKVKSPFQP